MLTQLVDLEPSQAALLDRICAGRLFTADVLRTSGALDVDDATRRQPRAAEDATDQVSLLLD